MTMLVRDLMKKKLYTIAESSSIQDTAKIMNEMKVSSIVILNANSDPVGLVTERDLVRKVCINDIPTNQVTNKEIMSSPLITINGDSSASRATDLMLKNNVRHLLVIDHESDGGDVPMGIITPLDLVKYEEFTRNEEHQDVLEMMLEYYI